MEGFEGDGVVVEAAGDDVGEGAEGGFKLGYLGGVGLDEGGVGGEPMGGEVMVGKVERGWGGGGGGGGG